MTKKNLSIFLIFLSLFANSQKGIINYGYIEALSSGNGKGPDYNAYMVFNKDQSYYVTAKDSLENSEKINDQKRYDDEDKSEVTIYNGIKVSKIGDQVVYHINKKTIWSNLYYHKQIYIKEVATKIDWKIQKETKKIGKFTCKKATTDFRGRKYTAWFTTEIALPFGPWKLNGLPGLILEAYDTNKNVYWYFKNVTYPSNTKEKVKYLSVPIKEKILSYTDFKKRQKKEQDKIVEKSILLKEQFPEVVVTTPELKKMFIECE